MINNLVKVENSPHLVRDVASGAIINRDYASFQEYERKRKLAANQKQEINTMKSDIVDIKTDIQELKGLMCQLLEKVTSI